MSVEAAAALPRPSTRLALAVALAAALIPLGSTMLAVAVPSIAGGVGIDAARLTPWIVTSYLVVSIACLWPGGRLADRIGTRRGLALGQLLFAAGAVTGTLATSLAALVAARVLMAAGGAVMVPAAMALLRELTAPELRIRAFGWFGSVMALAAAVGPLVGGEITTSLGWRAMFGLQVVPLLLSILLGLGTGGVMPAASAPPGGSLHDLRGLARSRSFVGGALATALQNTAMYAALFLMPLLLTDLRGESPADVGRALLGLTGSIVVGSFAGGHLADRWGARLVAVGAAALSVAGLLFLHDVAAIRSALDAVPGLVLLGLGVGLTNGPASGSAMSSVPAALSGTAAGLLSMLRYAGGVLGMALLAPLVPGSAVAAAEAQHALVMLLLAGAAALGGVAGLLLPGPGPRARD